MHVLSKRYTRSTLSTATSNLITCFLTNGRGHLQLCGFEGLFEYEDEDTWNENATWHYVSPYRRHREESRCTAEEVGYYLFMIWALST